MDIWHVRGGRKLSGSIRVQGSKNASLPIIAASIVSPMECVLLNTPKLRDVDAALKILRHLGCKAEMSGNQLYIDSRPLSLSHIPPSLMEEMRSSVIFMGALLARCGEARLSPPGGCQLGERPIDLHLKSLRELGAEIDEEDGEIYCKGGNLKGTTVVLPFPSVGATENILLAACAAKGKTHLIGAAREPEIVALAEFLRAAGAEISGDGTENIDIEGFRPRKYVLNRIIPDRIAGATLCCACAACGGDIQLKGAEFSSVLYFLNQAGCDIISGTHSLRVVSTGKLRAVKGISTAPYPGFPTDAQPVLMAALLKAAGESTIEENIFRNRFRHVPELRRLGADIDIDGKTAIIKGVKELHGTALNATDLRGGAAMIISALSAEGESVIMDEGHVRRGYERFDEALRTLGGEVYLET